MWAYYRVFHRNPGFSVLTLGCGLTIHFGGESFRKAISGHMILGIITVLLALTTTIMLVLE